MVSTPLLPPAPGNHSSAHHALMLRLLSYADEMLTSHSCEMVTPRAMCERSCSLLRQTEAPVMPLAYIEKPSHHSYSCLATRPCSSPALRRVLYSTSPSRPVCVFYPFVPLCCCCLTLTRIISLTTNSLRCSKCPGPSLRQSRCGDRST